MKLSTLIKIYDDLNRDQFAGALTRPPFYFTRATDYWACYQGDADGHGLFFNSRAIKGNMARSLVYHEMIHQFVEEIAHVDEGDNHHGPVFWSFYTRFAPADVQLFEEI